MQRVLDFVLAYGPAAAIYLCAAVLLARKEEIEGMDEDELDDPAMLHTILGRLPLIVADEEGDGEDGKGDEGGLRLVDWMHLRTQARSISIRMWIFQASLRIASSPHRVALLSKTTRGQKRHTGIDITAAGDEPDGALPSHIGCPAGRYDHGTIQRPLHLAAYIRSPFFLRRGRGDRLANSQRPSQYLPHRPHRRHRPRPTPTPAHATPLRYDEKDEKHPHRKRLSLREQTHQQTRMLAVVGLSGLLVAALFTASQQNPATTAGQVVMGGTEETKRVLTLIVSLLSSWGRVVGSTQ